VAEEKAPGLALPMDCCWAMDWGCGRCAGGWPYDCNCGPWLLAEDAEAIDALLLRAYCELLP